MQSVLCWQCSVYFNASSNENNPASLASLETRLNLYDDCLTYKVKPLANASLLTQRFPRYSRFNSDQMKVATTYFRSERHYKKKVGSCINFYIFFSFCTRISCVETMISIKS